MKKNMIRSPMLPPDTTGLSLMPASTKLASHHRYTLSIYHQHNFSGQSTGHTVFDQCRLEQVNLSTTELDDFELNDVELQECDLANASWRKVMVYRTTIQACRAVGLNVNEAYIKDVIFCDTNLMLAQFRFAEFKSVRFENCNLKGADFQNADLRGVVFEDCDLSEAEISFANLKNTDVRGCEIKNIRANGENLKGLIVEPFQAAYFAGLLGLQVKWTGDEISNKQR
ncbi:MAG: pentapeptide repeat-containing protein [Abditibacteriaceae bacterium]